MAAAVSSDRSGWKESIYQSVKDGAQTAGDLQETMNENLKPRKQNNVIKNSQHSFV